MEIKIIKGTAKLFCFELVFLRISTFDVFLLICFLFLIILTFLFFSVARQPDSDDGLFYILSSICFIVVIFFIWGRIKYPSKLDYYSRTWYCFKCGKYSIFKK